MNQQEHYNQKYMEEKEKYNELYSAYEKRLNAPEYFDIIGRSSYKMLEAVYLYQQLAFFQNMGKKAYVPFSSAQEIIVFYSTLIQSRKNSAQLLEDATYLVETGKIADEINQFLQESSYLPPNLAVPMNNEMISLARQCVQTIPQSAKLMTKAFRYHIIESALLSVPLEDMNLLLQAKFILPQDLECINLALEENQYQEKIKAICDFYQIEQPATKSYNLKLKGVTFPNEDGSSRQDLLLKLKEALGSSTPTLTAKPYTYIPEIGDPEPAIGIYWDEKQIGNIGKDVVADLMERFENPSFRVQVKAVSGGENGIGLGCSILLSVIGKEKPQIEQSTEQTQERV